jgi:hypothetical protein
VAPSGSPESSGRKTFNSTNAATDCGQVERATGPVYRASFSTGGYRCLTPRVFTGLVLTEIDTRTAGCDMPLARD